MCPRTYKEMASYEEKDYEQVLLQSIRPNVVVPFDCYLLLKENDRIVHFIKKGQVFPEDRIEKLKTFKHNTLYIHTSSKADYVAYLESFFQTKEGKQVLKELVDKNPNEKIQGIPSEIDVGKVVAEQTTDQKDDGKVKSTSDGTVEDTTSVSSKKTLEEKTVVKQVTDRQHDEETKVAELSSETEDATKIPARRNEKLEQIVAALKSDVDQLDDEVHASDSLTEEQAKLIKSVTDRINEELQKVKGRPDDPETKTKIDEVTEKIKEELVRVRGIAEKSNDALARTLIKTADEAEEELKALVGEKTSLGRFKQKVLRLKRIADPNAVADADEVAADGVNRMIRKVEGILGIKLKIEKEEGPSELQKDAETLKKGSNARRPAGDVVKMARMYQDYLKNHLASHSDLFTQIFPPYEILLKKIEDSIGDKDGAESRPSADREPTANGVNIAAMKDLIEQQKQTIKALESKQEFASNALKDVVQNWGEFSAIGRKVFGPDQNNAAAKFQVHLDTLKTAYSDTEQQAGSLIRVSMKVIEEVGTVAAQTPTSANAPRSEKKSMPEKNSGGSATLSVPVERSDSSNIEELRSENDVLRVQLQNAKSLLEKGEQKIAELKKMHEENDSYITALEKEGLENKEMIKKSQDQVASIEAQNIRHGEHSNELEKQLNLVKADVEAKDLIIRECRDKILGLEKDLRVFSDALKTEGLDPELLKETDPSKLPFKPEAVALVAEKEKAISRLNESLERKAEELKEAKREIAKLRGLVQGTNQLKKQISSKVDRINVERDTLVKSQDGLQRKIIALQNLAESERKSVSKLTGIIEELRKDRVDYMQKTANAMKDYKEMMGKATSLNNHVQAEAQRNKTLSEQNQTLLSKQKDLSTENVQLQKQLKNVEVELKRVQKMYKDATGSEAGNDRSVFEKRINDLREENKKIQTQYVTEQRKAQLLEKEVKALQFKLKNQKPNAA